MNLDQDIPAPDTLLANATPGSQTLLRALDVLERVAEGPLALTAIASDLGLSRSTVHRLATTLLERRYLNITPRRGYSLGPKLLELGCLARDQISLARLARPYLEALAAQTGDVALLVVPDGDFVLVADQVAGRRRLLPSLRSGDRVPIAGSVLGAAFAGGDAGPAIDDGETEPEICTIAAPVRGADGAVRAALGIAAASAYIDAAQVDAAAAALTEAARAMSAELGWRVSGLPADLSDDAAQQLPGNNPTAPTGHGVAGSVEIAVDEREHDRMGGPNA